MKSPQFSVRLTKEELIFSAAHFITFNGNICERLHGHNYRVAAEVRGPLDENHYVYDFIALKETLKNLIAAWDHHVLLPLHHPRILVRQTDGEVIATFEERRWVFPAEDCVLLPVANTTAELLAAHLAEQLAARLRALDHPLPLTLAIGVDECAGQWAWCEIQL
ncbi:MAG: 6-pyruvoyl tetrahydropterin synthase family protein [Pirellulales bacterium]|nr:6-pyruvoyl tetrahydropterin synthase family protein [Pirellulales bacterium]